VICGFDHNFIIADRIADWIQMNLILIESSRAFDHEKFNFDLIDRELDHKFNDLDPIRRFDPLEEV